MKLKYPYLWSFWRKLTWPFAAVSFSLLLQVALVVALPLPAKYIIDHLITGASGDPHTITFLDFSLTFTTYQGLLLFSGLTLILSGTQVLAEWIEGKVTTDIVFITAERIRKDLFHKIFTRRQTYLDSKKKVDILGKISGDVSNLENIVVFGMPAAVRAFPTIVTLIFTMFLLNVKFTLIFCLCLPVFYLFTHLFTNKMRLSAKKLRRKTVRFEEEIYEAASSMAIVKSLKGEQKVLQKILGSSSEVTHASGKFRDASLWLDTSINSTQHIVRVGLLLLGGISILKGNLTFGDLYVFMSYLGSITKPLNDITKFLARWAKTSASMDRVEEFNFELVKYPEICGTLEIQHKSESDLVFENMSFGYSDSKAIFNRFSLKFPNKSLVAVVGQSGIGKSSFSRLLNRLEDPFDGYIKIGGVDIKQFTLDSLRKYVRIISQETFLISGTVRENLILAAKENTSDDELLQALEAVNALSFIQALPDGLDTIIGEGGQQISGGQAKRIHLARGFLDMESEIIVFDEPTTGLDTISSQIVMSSVQKLAQTKKLVFWITHRMQEVHLVDKVLFFLPGQNPILDSHDSLIQNQAQYRALVEQKQDKALEGSPPITKNKLDRSELESEELEENLV